MVYTIRAGEGIALSGEAQSPTINNTGILELVAGTGISVDGNEITSTITQGLTSLSAGTGISVDGNKITNTGITSLTAGTGISISGSTITNTYSFTPDYTEGGWTVTGTTVGLTTTTNSVVVDGLTFGNATITNGNSILPDTDLGSDLGSSSYRFNDLWVANINSNSSQSFSGQTTFSYPPTDTTIDEASVLINPTTSAASGQLLGLAIAGYQKALIDEDGDIILGYSDATSAPASDYPLNIYGHSGTRVSFVDTSGNGYFAGSVGIGSVDPETPLHIAHATTPYIRLENTTAGKDDWEVRAQNDNKFVIFDSTNSKYALIIDSNTSGRLTLETDGDFLFSGGNVGIGTTDPGAKLEITSGNILLKSTSTSTNGIYIGDSNWGLDRDALNPSYGLRLKYYADGSNTRQVGFYDESSNAYVAYSDTSKNFIIPPSAGLVGIGTVDPGSTLDVNGTITGTGLKITTTPSSGYVLTSDANGLASWQPASGGTSYWTDDTTHISPNTIGVNILRIWDSGGLSIGGTTDPGAGNLILGDGTTGGELFLAGKASSATTTEGAQYYDTDDDQLKVYANGKWQSDRTTATKIVAASDSQNKEKADYVADGTQDEDEINAALAALPASGGSVVLLDGTYSIGNAGSCSTAFGVNITASNVSLVGAGDSTILSRACQSSGNDGVITASGSITHVTISHLAINGNKASYAANNNYGIYLSTISYSLVDSVYIYNTYGHGVFDNSGAQNTITNSRIHTTTLDGINTSSNYSNYSDNYIYNPDGEGVQSTGTANRITNNYIYSSASDAILAAGFNTISDNYLDDPAASGIEVSSNSNSISGNIIYSHGAVPGIYVTAGVGNSITGNTFYNEGGESIHTAGARTTISSNTATVIRLTSDNNTVSGNTMYGAGSATAINVASGTNNYLAANNISGTYTTKVTDAGTSTVVQHNDRYLVSGATTGKALAIFNETGDQAILTASASGVTRFTIASDGAITTSLGTGTVYSNAGVLTNVEASDRSLKDNILELEDGTLDKVLGLKPVSFAWKSTGDGALGFIAQDVAEIFPELVGSNQDGTLGLYTTQFIPVLAKAIQEQQLAIDSLDLQGETLKVATNSADIAELKGRVGVIEGLLVTIEEMFNSLKEKFTTKEIYTDKLCVGSEESATCLDKSQVDEVIKLIPSPTPVATLEPDPSPSPSPLPSPAPSEDSTPSGSDTTL